MPNDSETEERRSSDVVSSPEAKLSGHGNDLRAVRRSQELIEESLRVLAESYRKVPPRR